MSIRRLVELFAETTVLPIEITDVRQKILELGIQDEIRFVDEPLDTGRLKGAFYQYVRRDVPYGDPILCTMVVYPSELSVAEQRLISCKEMVHVFDVALERPTTRDEVSALVDQLLSASAPLGQVDVTALNDRLALYQALVVLFPNAARDQALAQIQSGAKTVEEIADWAQLPVSAVKLVLHEGWPDLCRKLIDC